MFRSQCRDVGLGHLSVYGVCKGLAGLGCSQYEVMAILSLSEAKTIKVYTRRVERWRLANGAMERVAKSGIWEVIGPTHLKPLDRFTLKCLNTGSHKGGMVRSRRLELPRVAPQRPQRCASTNSATTASW